MRTESPSRFLANSGRPVLITGGAGFIGSNLADRLASSGSRVIVYDALARPGVEANLAWLQRRHPERISTVVADLRDRQALAEAVGEAQAVFHFAAQVAVTTSLLDPCEDADINIHGTILLLDTVRRCSNKMPVIFASTNKVYGDLADIDLVEADDRYLPSDPTLRDHGISEARPLSFHTPYGCSKGAADQYVLDYAHSFGLPTAVLRMSCIYGPRQLGTEDQGWVAHFLRRALSGQPITIFGDGRQVRDLLYVEDAIEAYLAALRRISAVAGHAFNLGGGPANAVSLLQIVSQIESLLGRPVELNFEKWRSGDQRYFVADSRRATASLGLPRPRSWRRGLAELTKWLRSEESGMERTSSPSVSSSAPAAAAS